MTTTMTTTMKIALAQVRARIGDKRANFEKICEVVRKVDADLIVFPELFLTGYFCNHALYKLAEPFDGEMMDELLEMVRGRSSLIFGFPELDADKKGIIYNSAAILTGRGDRFCYRKIHTANFGPFREGLFFKEGEDAGPIFDIDIGKEDRSAAKAKVGLFICYDLFFPELSYALRESDILIDISASPITSRESFLKILPARAIENTAFMLYVNNVGIYDQLLFWGGSRVISPSGITIEESGEGERIIEVSIDLDSLSLARALRPVLRDG